MKWYKEKTFSWRDLLWIFTRNKGKRTFVFFLTYLTADKITGHCMAEVEISKKNNPISVFMKWCSDTQDAIESELDNKIAVTNIKIIK